jgi:hypothetical protein
VDIVTRHRISTGVHAWRKLIHQLIEMRSLFGPFADNLYSPPLVCYNIHIVFTKFKFLFEECVFRVICI